MIGIYGGTFDPVHFGHLRTALEVRELFALDRIHLLPSHVPPHRARPSVSASRRVRMLELAVSGRDDMIVDTREIDRDGPSYMVETLSSLRADIGVRCPVLLFIGADAFAGLKAWFEWSRLFDLAHLVVMTRPGYEPGAPDPFFISRCVGDRQILCDEAAGRLLFQPVTQLEISASAIRRIIAEKRDPGFLLPDPVIQYIRRHKLYER